MSSDSLSPSKAAEKWEEDKMAKKNSANIVLLLYDSLSLRTGNYRLGGCEGGFPGFPPLKRASLARNARELIPRGVILRTLTYRTRGACSSYIHTYVRIVRMGREREEHL